MPHVPHAVFVWFVLEQPRHTHKRFSEADCEGGGVPIQCHLLEGSCFHSKEFPEDRDGECHCPALWPPARPCALHAGMGVRAAGMSE